MDESGYRKLFPLKCLETKLQDMSDDEQSRKRKRHRSKGGPSEKKSVKSLWWKRGEKHVPVASENAMIEVLVRWGKKERGMIKDQPPFRLATIQRQLKQAPGMRLEQALSLRRHHMKLLNPQREMQALGLGKANDIRTCAEIFERVVEEFLVEQKINYLNEAQQKLTFQGKILTPDFLLPFPIKLKIFEQTIDGKREVIQEQTIHWIEAKMFYGASTIPSGTAGAVGSILPKVKKYVDKFGTGAIIFMHGCGDLFAEELAVSGVTAVNGSIIPRRLLKRVWDHQRLWCAKDNLILP